MTRVITTVVLAALGMGCEPEANDDPEPAGMLEYEHPYAQIYRSDHRIDIILNEGSAERRECGVLSERVHGELEATLAGLDPGEDYGRGPELDQCTTPPGASIHIDGFEHSPFQCDFQCCRPELMRAAVVYMAVETYFSDGDVLTFDGEPYIAIEPDMRCP